METTKLKVLYVVTTRAERSYWTKIGMAYMNRDGSMTLSFDAFPANNNRVQMRDYSPRDIETGEPLPNAEQPIAPPPLAEPEARAKAIRPRRSMTVDEALP